VGSMFGVVVMAFFILVCLAMQGPTVSSLFSTHALVVVIGGSIAATFLAFPADVVMKVPRLMWEAVRPTKLELPTVVATLVRISDRVRQSGLNGIMGELKHIEDPFLRRGLQYVAEGFDSKEIEELMEADLISIRGRHRNNIGVFDTLGGFAPTLGILGTVLSMVAVLGNLANPEELGPEIAEAMLATLYGVGAANLLFIPMGSKLKKLSEEELRIRWVMIEAILLIQGGAHPRVIRERLKVALPPKTRKMIQDVKGKRRRGTQSMGTDEMVVPQMDEG